MLFVCYHMRDLQKPVHGLTNNIVYTERNIKLDNPNTEEIKNGTK